MLSEMNEGQDKGLTNNLKLNLYFVIIGLFLQD